MSRTPAALALSALVLAACNACGTPSAVTAPEPAAADPASAPPAAPATGALPDLGKSMVHGLCADGPGAEGADSYFTGELKIAGGTVSGTEAWVLFANPRWQARGGKDCRLVWDVKGTVGKPTACGDCDLGISFHAEPRIASDCPEELVQGRKLPTGQRVGGEGVAFDQKYDIKRNADGTTTVYFGRTGKLLGEGFHAGEDLNWLSAHACKWF